MRWKQQQSPATKPRRLISPYLSLVSLLVPAFALSAPCEHPVARLVAFQGEAEEQAVGTDRWTKSAPERSFCAGDRIRTGEHSRATLELANKTYLSLEQRTTIVFSGLKPHEPSWLDLVKGAIYLRSRTPSSLDIRTPFINAAIKGTEFLVESDDQQGQVSVLEGRIEASNPRGSVLLTAGQSAIGRIGAAPQRKILLTPRDAVHWALYYPPVLDTAELRRLSPAAAHFYEDGDTAAALAALGASDASTIARSALLLEVGRADEASALLDTLPMGSPHRDAALPLQSVIALARNDKTHARTLAEQATVRLPRSPAAWTALSYVEQSEFRLEQALDSAHKASELTPENARALARQAELTAALGRASEARQLTERAVSFNPHLARAWVLRGLAQLNEGDIAQAEATLQEAARLDSADPLAHFGLGLAKIRRGRLDDGTAELEIAASLDPNDALSRSYLGKAYFEQKNAKVAATELEIAKQLDPLDPTPWFYDAIRKQTVNRPVEALQDMQQATRLNGNRAVYRSKQLLDSDLAARSAAQGRIYNDLGFGQRALVEGWKSVNADPGDYSAHRLLADNYANLPNHELARVSELLQSQLLQPLNVTPLQPHLAERNLAIAPGSGPSQSSFNEFNPMFLRNGFNLQTSGVVGSNDTYGDEVVHSGLWNNFSYSLGQFHHETDGFRPNNRVSQDIYNAFFQGNLTPDLNVQAEYRHRGISHGDLLYKFDLFDSANNRLDPLYSRKLESDTYRVGARYTLTPQSQFIASGIYRSENEALEASSYLPPPTAPTVQFNSPNRGYMVEGQYLFSSHYLDLNVGGGYHENRTHSDATPLDFFGFPIDLSRPAATVSQGTAYVYSHIHAPQQVTWTLGGSLNTYDDKQFAQRFNLLNPKVGVSWDITPSTTLRAAAFRTLKRSLLTDQTIEPTQIAGFNQLFDDLSGTKAWRYGVGLDQKFGAGLFGGVEVSRRDRAALLNNPDDPGYRYVPDRETLYRAYASWAPSAELALNLAYRLEVFDRHNMSFPNEPDTRTHSAPLTVNYFHPAGWLAHLTTTYVNQTARVNGTFLVPAVDGKPELHDEFVLLDAGLGYRLPGRHGMLRFDVNNLLGQKFSYFGPAYRTGHEERPLFYPERTFTARFTLAF